MDLTQMAGHLSLEFGVAMEGPFGVPEGHTTVKLWLPNRRGVSLSYFPERDKPGTTDLAVLRETVPERGKDYDGTPSRLDYSTPVTIDTITGADLDIMRAALRILRELPEVDVWDMRSTRDLRAKGFVHYGHSTTACGSLGPDDTVTEHISGIRCLPCMVEVHRPV